MTATWLRVIPHVSASESPQLLYLRSARSAERNLREIVHYLGSGNGAPPTAKVPDRLVMLAFAV